MSGSGSLDPVRWSKVAREGRWDEVIDEEVVAAFQDLRGTADDRLLALLSDRITTRIQEIVRSAISHNFPDEGWEAVHEAVHHLGIAVLDASSPDGEALRCKFELTARRRATDAVRRLIKALMRRAPDVDADDDHDLPIAAVRQPSQEDAADVAKILTFLPDDQERLAFLLHCDDAPITGQGSICEALGVSRPKAKKILERARRRVEAALRSRPQARRSP